MWVNLCSIAYNILSGPTALNCLLSTRRLTRHNVPFVVAIQYMGSSCALSCMFPTSKKYEKDLAKRYCLNERGCIALSILSYCFLST